MKLVKLLCALVMMFSAVNAFAEKVVFEYSYDAAGNRISRTFTTVSGKQAEPAQQKIADYSVKVFPNPVVDFVTVSLDGISKDNEIKIELYDINGSKLFYSQENSSEFKLDLSGKAAGYYLLNVYIDGKATYWKILKE